MKVLRTILFSILGIMGLAIVISFFLPSEHEIKRSITIKASQTEVWTQLNSPKLWENWMPAPPEEANVALTYTGPESGEGAKAALRAQGQPEVLFTITTSIPMEKIGYEMDIEGSEFKMWGIIEVDSTSEGINVTFIDQMQVGNNVMYKYYGLMAEKMAGPQLDSSLVALKEYCER
jgi:uncharacterized protein YndB with AHSA1/START domain